MKKRDVHDIFEELVSIYKQLNELEALVCADEEEEVECASLMFYASGIRPKICKSRIIQLQKMLYTLCYEKKGKYIKREEMQEVHGVLYSVLDEVTTLLRYFNPELKNFPNELKSAK